MWERERNIVASSELNSEKNGKSIHKNSNVKDTWDFEAVSTGYFAR